ncbi:branched-chain amino acid ABC transporter permease [Hydrogenophilus thermoluteolus]|uniref:Branched-chain amino acid ABC transporter permease n=1 Tax=Hydrogenophilus thermoluteolus TaxID=297 RepID=A0A2Z6DWM0_HYDTE|nr:branched-chain amino acid ABC transporter permease [Hydrogenophilus thermoluteolus]BBD76728.1 branched-chain amino acid ABC transporter permease [Hydrogenophilus thermoluteolus]
MDWSIALILTQDGVVNAAIYALLALALVLVFAVTRIIFIPQGEYVSYGALTLAMLELGKTPATVWLLVAGGAVALAMEAFAHFRGRSVPWREALFWYAALPLLTLAFAYAFDWQTTPQWARILLTVTLIAAMGPITYRIFYQPIAEAPVLVLLIVSVAVHLALVGLGLLIFGAEGYRTEPLWDDRFSVGPLLIPGQALWVIGASLVLIALLAWFFSRTLYGKALRATAVNRNGARLMGISPNLAGRLTLLLAAAIGAISGVLVSPITTLYYDSGFLIGLKGFVAAIIGGLASYPIAALGALAVGLIEAFSSFWASAYKEVIVFTLIIPVLFWRSLTTHHVEEE